MYLCINGYVTLHINVETKPETHLRFHYKRTYCKQIINKSFFFQIKIKSIQNDVPRLVNKKNITKH